MAAGGRPGIFAIRDVSSLVTETHEGGHELKRAVSGTQLMAMGVGAIIGTGIFVIVGEGVRLAGPAVILSFILAAVACTFSALSYAELASAIPVSGSAYTYTYATLGEIVAWIIGWDLIIEYGVSVAAVAIGWGASLNEFLDAAFDYHLPDAIVKSPEDGGVFNLPAVLVVLALTFLLVRGTRESARANVVMVAVKLGVLLFFIVIAFANFSTKNFTPFAPHGWDSVTSAAAIIFFAYIGFDAVSTGSEEARNPAKDLPFAVIGSLVVVTIFYILTVLGALAYGTPANLTIGLGVLIALLAALVPLSKIIELVNIGTLFAFVLVNIGVLVLRRTRPDMPRPYKVPWSPWFPLLGVVFAVYLMKDLPLATWIRFVAWLAVGMLIYAFYGYRNSRLRMAHGEYGVLPAEEPDILHRHEPHRHESDE